ncbi:MAG: hypothetical protein PVS3B1_14840 [Ktedonobacteraceae bacterium]
MQRQRVDRVDRRKGRGLSVVLVALLALCYLVLLAALVFLPGQSFLERLRWLDSGVCAQLPTHSLYPGGERLPLCSRNTGIYLGFFLTVTTLYISGRGRAQRLPPWPISGALACGILAMAVDGTNSLLLDLGLPHLYFPHNLLRLATGMLTGLALATLVLPILNQLFWCDYNEQRSIPSWSTLVQFLPALVLCYIALVSQSGLILYPVALLSTLGLLGALGSVNLIAIIAIGKRDQSFVYYRELLPFFGLAFLCACGEMLILAQLKLMILHASGITL